MSSKPVSECKRTRRSEENIHSSVHIIILFIYYSVIIIFKNKMVSCIVFVDKLHELRFP